MIVERTQSGEARADQELKQKDVLVRQAKSAKRGSVLASVKVGERTVPEKA